ncbi:MAG: DUF4397 domain-containing protein, partial [Chitinophagaceae bacterium]|nr:DUF4397 domain-containing protein [Chitinophagaceae bacterium]
RDIATSIPLASLKVINIVSGGDAVKLRGVPHVTINNNGIEDYGILVSKQDLYIYPTADSLHPYFNGNNSKVELDAQQCYSLFLGGTPSEITPVLIHENWDMKYDGNIYVRVLNFSPGGPPITVNLSATPEVKEFSNIEYARWSDFKSFTKSSVNPSYQFEVRNANTDDLITTVTLSAFRVARFNHFTLVLRGIVDGSPAPGVTSVIHN